MRRTQISLDEEDRRLLDAAAAATGRSLSALIRDAVRRTYGGDHDVEDDVAAIRRGQGAWRGRDLNGAEWVESLRSGRRLGTTS